MLPKLHFIRINALSILDSRIDATLDLLQNCKNTNRIKDRERYLKYLERDLFLKRKLRTKIFNCPFKGA